MIESLKDLDSDLKTIGSRLHIFYGENKKVLKQIVKKIKVENIVFNVDYTPYSRKRDKKIKKFCDKNNINCVYKQDYLLADIGTFMKKDGTPYTVFTPFRNNGLTFDITKVKKIKLKKYGENK